MHRTEQKMYGIPIQKHKCVLCGSYKQNMRYTCGGIGACDDCCSYDVITTKNKCFEGKGDVDFVISPYLYEGAMRDAVRAYKFNNQKLYGILLGQMMCCELENINVFSDYDMLVPVPLHENRQAERGYNQSEIIAEELSKWLGIPSYSEAMKRIRDTKRQSSLYGRDRIENVRGAFHADMLAVTGKNIILVDDIYTMGETVKACAAALKAAGAGKIIAITLCRAVLKEEQVWKI